MLTWNRRWAHYAFTSCCSGRCKSAISSWRSCFSPYTWDLTALGAWRWEQVLFPSFCFLSFLLSSFPFRFCRKYWLVSDSWICGLSTRWKCIWYFNCLILLRFTPFWYEFSSTHATTCFIHCFLSRSLYIFHRLWILQNLLISVKSCWTFFLFLWLLSTTIAIFR